MPVGTIAYFQFCYFTLERDYLPINLKSAVLLTNWNTWCSGVIYFDALYFDALYSDALYSDALYSDAQHFDALHFDALYFDALYFDTLHFDTPKTFVYFQIPATSYKIIQWDTIWTNFFERSVNFQRFEIALKVSGTVPELRAKLWKLWVLRFSGRILKLHARARTQRIGQHLQNHQTLLSIVNEKEAREAIDRSALVFSSIVPGNAHFKRRISAPIQRSRKLPRITGCSLASLAHTRAWRLAYAPGRTLPLPLNLPWKERRYADVYIVTLSRLPFFMLINGTRFIRSLVTERAREHGPLNRHEWLEPPRKIDQPVKITRNTVSKCLITKFLK